MPSNTFFSGPSPMIDIFSLVFTVCNQAYVVMGPVGLMVAIQAALIMLTYIVFYREKHIIVIALAIILAGLAVPTILGPYIEGIARYATFALMTFILLIYTGFYPTYGTTSWDMKKATEIAVIAVLAGVMAWIIHTPITYEVENRSFVMAYIILLIFGFVCQSSDW